MLSPARSENRFRRYAQTAPSPPGFVEIETIFFRLAVKGDEALVVAALDATFVAHVGGEVEHVPNMRAPKIRPLVERFKHAGGW
jgi:hypothetical protein